MLNKESAFAIYRDIWLIRQAEEKIRQEYRSDAMKTPVHLHIGAEAICAGVLHALPRGIKVFGTYRNHGLYLPLTQDPDSFFAELYGRAAGCAQGKAGSMHLTAPEKGLFLTSAVVATTIPVAVGAAFAHAYRGETDPVAVFFGDGAMEEGAFYESINFACLHKLRIFFICEDNGLAIHTPVSSRQGYKSIPDVAAAFNCYHASAEGHEPERVYDKTLELFEKMKKDPKPCFLHFSYFRYLEHVGISEDFAAGYRPKPSPADMERMDPVPAAERMALKYGVTPEALESARREIDARLTEAVKKAQQAAFPDETQFSHGVLNP